MRNLYFDITAALRAGFTAALREWRHQRALTAKGYGPAPF